MPKKYSIINKKRWLDRIYAFLYYIGSFITRIVNGGREFCFTNYSVVDLLFTIIYTVEQVFLIRFTFIYRGNTDALIQGISYFALIVIFTFGMHKVFMQSRIKYLESNLTEYRHKSEFNIKKLEDSLHRQVATNEKLREFMLNPQSLNTSRLKNAKRGVKNDK